MSQLEGTLIVKVISAKLFRDTETFGKMDPFCVLQSESAKVQTTVKQDAGKTPIWNETFSLRSRVEEKIQFSVLDEDPFTNDLVGESSFVVSKLLVNKKESFTYPIFYKEAKAGEVTLELIYHPNNENYVKLTKELQDEIDQMDKEIEKLKQELVSFKISEPQHEVQRIDPNKATAADLRKENEELLLSHAKCEQELGILEKQMQNQKDQLHTAQLSLEKAKIEGDGLVKELSDLKNLSIAGSLVLTNASAVLLKDSETFGKMDPYFVLKCGTDIKKSTVATDQGKTPKWSEGTFSFDRKDEDSVCVQVFAKGSMMSDTFHGFGSFAVMPLIIFGKKVAIQVDLYHPDGKSGTWSCEAVFKRK